MHNSLYLDTARLGQMSPTACDASIDFARFANEHGCTLYFSQLLRDGFLSWPLALQRQYPGLSDWDGVPRFKSLLRQLADADADSEVLLTSRTASLMKFAARLMAGPCRNILITDNCWPAYRRILELEQQKTGFKITVVPVRHLILRESVSSFSLIEYLANEFVRHQCDGLFLPLVDNLGVHLPVEKLVKRIREEAELRFVVVDGAQAIGHVPLRMSANYCDLLLAGSHKWLRAFYTMGVGYFGNPQSRDFVADSLERWIEAGVVDDPLLTFSDELAQKSYSPYGETVQVAPLLVANAATSELLETTPRFEHDNLNRTAIMEIAREAGWKSVAPDREMASQIQLIEYPSFQRKPVPANDICQSLLAKGVSATAYPNGMLRLSSPMSPLKNSDRLRLSDALISVAKSLHEYF